jgi:UPF0176 protein
MTQPIVVAALYKFVTLEDYVELREPLLKAMLDNGVKGTLLLAHEGINGTVSATREGIDGLLAWLRNDPRWTTSTIKSRTATSSRSTAPRSSSRKRSSPSACRAWTRTRRSAPTSSRRLERLISDPEVLLIDTRNDYEVAIGTFKGAIDPKTETFREFPEYIKANFDPASTRRSRCSAPVASVAKKPRATCSVRASKRSIISRAAS